MAKKKKSTKERKTSRTGRVRAVVAGGKVKKSAKARSPRKNQSPARARRKAGAAIRVRPKSTKRNKLSPTQSLKQSAAALESPLSFVVSDLGLSPNAKAAAGSLLKQFGADKIAFTSGRRDIAGQAKAMAGHVVNKRKWIMNTYAD